MKKLFSKFALVAIFFSVFSMSFVAFAGDADGPGNVDEDGGSHGTLLPSTIKSVADCLIIMNWAETNSEQARTLVAKRQTLAEYPDGSKLDHNTVLACGIKTGDIKAWMVPFYIRYILEFIIGIAGLIAVGAVVYGGYLYMFGGVMDDKDKAKNAIKNGLMGIVLIFLAWGIVNIVISLFTS